MLNIQERVPTTIQNPNADEKILFNDATDGKLKTKDSSGVIEELSTDLVGVPTGGATGEVLAKASATDGDVEWIDPTGGVKEYVALLTQSGTDAPVATILKNTLGGIPVWSYVNIGEYRLTLVSAFNGTVPHIFYTDTQNDAAYYFEVSKISNDVIELLSKENASDKLNALLANTYIKIEVYP